MGETLKSLKCKYFMMLLVGFFGSYLLSVIGGNCWPLMLWSLGDYGEALGPGHLVLSLGAFLLG